MNHFESAAKQQQTSCFGGLRYKDFISPEALSRRDPAARYAKRFRDMIPEIERQLANPSPKLNKILENSYERYLRLLSGARQILSQPAGKSTVQQREQAIRALQYPGLALCYAVDAEVDRAIAYSSDQDSFGQPDVWRTPEETAETGLGDCEDAAILKYAVLCRHGFPADRLLLTIGYVEKGEGGVPRGGHALLVADEDDHHHVMNNDRPEHNLPDLREFCLQHGFYPYVMVNATRVLVVQDQAVRDVLAGRDAGLFDRIREKTPANLKNRFLFPAPLHS